MSSFFGILIVSLSILAQYHNINHRSDLVCLSESLDDTIPAKASIVLDRIMRKHLLLMIYMNTPCSWFGLVLLFGEKDGAEIP